MRKIISISVLILTIIASVVYISTKNSAPQADIPASSKVTGGTASTSGSAIYAYSDFDQFKEVNIDFSKKIQENLSMISGLDSRGPTYDTVKYAPALFPKGLPDNVQEITPLGNTYPYQFYRIRTMSMGVRGEIGSLIVDKRNNSHKIYHEPSSMSYEFKSGSIEDSDKGKYAIYIHPSNIYYYKAGDQTFHLIASSTLTAPEYYWKDDGKYFYRTASIAQLTPDVYTLTTYSRERRPLRTLTFDLNAIDKAQAAASSTYR